MSAENPALTLAELRFVELMCRLPGEYHAPERAAEARRLIAIKEAKMTPAERRRDVERRARVLQAFQDLAEEINSLEAITGTDNPRRAGRTGAIGLLKARLTILASAAMIGAPSRAGASPQEGGALEFLRDYLGIFPVIMAVVNGALAVFSAHYPFKTPAAK